MQILSMVFFASRLAWRQLIKDKAKFITAILGVLFACVLVFMQMGFKDSLFDGAAKLPQKFNGDLFIIHKQTEAIWRPVSFNKIQLMRTFGHKDVEFITPIYIGQAQWKNPETRTKRTLMVFGSEMTESIFVDQDVRENTRFLRRANTVLFDSASRPDFGNIVQLYNENGFVSTEVNDHKVDVVGFFELGASFRGDGNIIVSDQNFMRIFQSRKFQDVDIGMIKLKSHSNVQDVKNNLQSLLDESILVLTLEEMIEYELSYWHHKAPVGVIFGFGVIMGLVVGMIIVYQILFTDITNHINEYATLRAMGYSYKYLMLVVVASSFILAIIGFIPGLILSKFLYYFTHSLIFIEMNMTFMKVAKVFCLILGMCIISGALAMQKMKSADPADMF